MIETARRRSQLASLVSTPCPYTVLSTHAGALFHSLSPASMWDIGQFAIRGGSAVSVRTLPPSGGGLQSLRPWPDLLRRDLCTGSARAGPAGGGAALSGQPVRTLEACSAHTPLSGQTKDCDASGFTT